MKYIRTYENILVDSDIKYLADRQGTGIVEYIQKMIDFYKMSNEQLHNLKLSIEYKYLSVVDFSNVVGEIINFNKIWHF